MVTGIVAEYNPFHNGHKIQIDYARNTLKSDYIVVVLSPDYTQRGEIAILSKYERAQIALKLGVDLVLQIPINAATDSSQGYAYGSIKVLDSLGIVDTLLFSAEDDDISLLSRIADIELAEKEDYIETINSNMRSGLNYPSAREKAIMKHLLDYNSDMIHSVLKQPNNILAIEYIKALKFLNSNIKPICMKRVFSSYHDTIISNRIASATAIRNAIYNDEIDTIENVVPREAYSLYKNTYDNNMLLHPDDVSQILGSKLLESNLTNYKDCNESIAHKIENSVRAYVNYSEFKNILKSKDITETRISRVLCHIMLGITNDLYETINGKIQPIIPYIFILGFNDKGSELMKKVKNSNKLPFFTSINDMSNYDFDDKAKAILDADINATKLANIILANKSSSSVIPEQSRKFLKV